MIAKNNKRKLFNQQDHTNQCQIQEEHKTGFYLGSDSNEESDLSYDSDDVKSDPKFLIDQLDWKFDNLKT